MPGLDLLHRAQIQIHPFGQFFLCEPASHPLAPDIGAEGPELGGLQFVQWHAVLRRKLLLTRTAQWGVIATTSVACHRMQSWLEHNKRGKGDLMIPPVFGILVIRAVTGAWDKITSPSKNELARAQAADERRRAQAEALADARRYCEDCKTELKSPATGKYCPTCGSQRITTRAEARAREKARQQELQREREEAERREKAHQETERARQQAIKQRESRLQSARDRCRTMASARSYCSQCHAERDTVAKFCEICGRALDSIPTAVGFKRVNNEFPDLVPTEDDYKRFAKKGFWR